MYTTIVLHANLQYAEIPKSEINQVVQKSYIPVLKNLLEIPKCFCVLNFTGYTLEILQEEYPSVIELIEKGVGDEKFELTGCGYAHPIFPLISMESKKKQIEFNLRAMEKILNYRPKGFWLPELAYDPTLPLLLKENNYEYMFIDEELYRFSLPLVNSANPFNRKILSSSQHLVKFFKVKNPLKKAIKYFKTIKIITEHCLKADFYPVEVKGTLGSITALKISNAWNIYSSAVLSNQPFLTIRRLIKLINNAGKHNNGLIIPYGTDIEFFGYRTLIDGSRITEKRLEYFLRKIIEIEDNTMILPSNYLKEHKPREIGYLKTGSWAPEKDLALWLKEEDNQLLDRLMDEIKMYLAQISPEQIDDEIWRDILLAENSDGRGWDPIPERRLDCLAHALTALKKLKEKAQQTKR